MCHIERICSSICVQYNKIYHPHKIVYCFNPLKNIKLFLNPVLMEFGTVIAILISLSI